MFSPSPVFKSLRSMFNLDTLMGRPDLTTTVKVLCSLSLAQPGKQCTPFRMWLSVPRVYSRWYKDRLQTNGSASGAGSLGSGTQRHCWAKAAPIPVRSEGSAPHDETAQTKGVAAFSLPPSKGQSGSKFTVAGPAGRPQGQTSSGLGIKGPIPFCPFLLGQWPLVL